jgi:RNA recognition motif-containing protein
MYPFDQFQGHFQESSVAAAAIAAKNEPFFEPSRTLFLGDLSYFCSEEDLCALFHSYGPIAAVRIRRGVTGESLLHGFIAFHSAEATMRAVQELDGKEFMGRILRSVLILLLPSKVINCSLSDIRVQLGTAVHQNPLHDKERIVQLHVSFISKQVRDVSRN